MRKRITFDISEELNENMEKYKPFIDYGAVAATAFKREIDRAKKIEAKMLMEDKVKKE